MSETRWKELSPALLPEHFNENLVKNWLLVTAGSPESLGTMTVNWGGSGFIWKQHVVFLVIRESRNTLRFLKEHSDFSLTMFDSSYQEKLTFCGRNSGRDVDKVSACGFTPCFYGDAQVPLFEEAHTAVICRQIYRGLMEESDFIGGTNTPLWQTWYNTGAHTGDRHHLIIASVEKVLTNLESDN